MVRSTSSLPTRSSLDGLVEAVRLLCPESGSFSTAVRGRAEALLEADFRTLDQASFDHAATDYDAVLVRFNTRVGAAVMGTSSHLRAVMSPTTGLDHIDLALARKRRIAVFHLRGQTKFLRTINPTAEMTIALMLALLRKLPQAANAVLEGVGKFRRSAVAKSPEKPWESSVTVDLVRRLPGSRGRLKWTSWRMTFDRGDSPPGSAGRRTWVDCYTNPT